MGDRLGSVVAQAGLGMATRGTIRGEPIRPGPKRGIVLRTYVQDTPHRPKLNTAAAAAYGIACDVLLVRSHAILYNVAVQQRACGFSDADLWIPKGMTGTVDTQEPVSTLNGVSKRGTRIATQDIPTVDRLDGDHVLVEFLDSRQTSPIIVGPWVHPRTLRTVTEGDGAALADLSSTRGAPKSRERYVRFAGTEARIDAFGNAVLDTVGANPTDSKTEAPDPDTGGEVKLSLKTGQKLVVEVSGTQIATFTRTGSAVDIRLATDSADQPFIRGTDKADADNALADALNTYQAQVTAAFASLAPAPPGTPLTSTHGAAALLTVTTAGTVLATAVSTHNAARNTYLSTQIKGD